MKIPREELHCTCDPKGEELCGKSFDGEDCSRLCWKVRKKKADEQFFREFRAGQWRSTSDYPFTNLSPAPPIASKTTYQTGDL